MKLIVGLGNPGSRFQATRHNLGSWIVRELARSEGAVFKKSPCYKSLWAKIRGKEENILLVIPVSFMNLCGGVVKSWVRRKRLNLADLLVVLDDLNLSLGKLRLRPKGSNGGHLGLRSIINVLRDSNFSRLKMGIDRPSKQEDISRYVLSPFSLSERKLIRGSLQKAVDCCLTWAKEGVAVAMNRFNLD